MPQSKKQVLGSWGETQARNFLERQGYRIVGQNVFVGREEIDLVAWDDQALCFIEVKTRTGSEGSAERATQGNKFEHMKRAASRYCRLHNVNTNTTSVRFEHVSVYLQKDVGTAKLIRYFIA
jgi:putative endonuclease